MADGLYVNMAGAVARAAQLDSVADNLSNATSPGFKAGRPAFQNFLAQANDKVYPAAVASGFDLRPGDIQRTGNPMDIVPEGTSFLAVQNGNQIAYTRDGRLRIDAEGFLVIGDKRVLGVDGQPVSIPPGAQITLQSDAVISAFGNPIGQLALYQLDGPLQRVGSGMMAPSEGGVAMQVVGPIRIGELEKGNANTLEAAIALVNVQRHYENSMQALQTGKRMDERANELGRVR